MCELFGMSSNQPVEPFTSLIQFGKRGGDTADNPDGWGLAYLENKTWQLHKAPEAAAQSQHFANLSETIHTNLMIAHVRKANPPTAHNEANTHPFLRECCGRPWIFAHNGKVPEVIQPDGCCHPQNSQPLGETDSEHAFYFLLDEIAILFASATVGDGNYWSQKIATLSAAIAAYGQFNFLMSDGVYLIAYMHDRLHALEGCDNNKPWVMIASEPLNGEPWRALNEGELRVYCNGVLVEHLETQPVGVRKISII